MTKKPGKKPLLPRKGAKKINANDPFVVPCEIHEIDLDGDMFARPMEWDERKQGKTPRIEIAPDEGKGRPALKEGDRALIAVKPIADGVFEGKIIRRIDDSAGRVMGQILRHKRGNYILQPASKRAKHDFDIDDAGLNGAKEGDIVVAEIMPARGLARKKVKVTEIIGRQDDPKAISLIALFEAGLSEKFPEDVILETKGMTVPDLKGREDLRSYPLVTIDGADARDFDDAVFAEQTDGGYHLIVAIADVSFYVRPGSALDREAYRRGNSTYFPDRVVPMLPEALSNDLCSLRPKENRACLAFHLYINENGDLTNYKIVRGLMRSEARLTYEQVQAIHNHNVIPSEAEGSKISPLRIDRSDAPVEMTTNKDLNILWQPIIRPLYEAYEILDKARRKRGALDLDLPERKILIDDKGNMIGVKNRERLDSHKLIEEFMILANVAAAMALEKKNAPCVYRVHDRPSADKLENAREFLDAFGLSLPKGGQNIKPAQINLLLQKAKESPYSHLVSEMLLRTQSQAVYSPENIGHFGLALQKYAHFTSPIRRYADLLVHRSLIRAYDLGPGGLTEEEAVTLEEKSEHISQTERTSAEAERNAVDRFTARWMSQRIGEEFKGRINGVTRFGLFVTLDENGADGLIPIRTLPQDYYIHDEKQHALIGKRGGIIYRLGAPLTVRIVEADGFTGSSVFEVIDKNGADLPGMTFRRQDHNRQHRSEKPKATKKKPFFKKRGKNKN
jgi:ribonuclease R